MFEKFLTQKISKHFTWAEAIWCPSWSVYCLPDDNVTQNIIKTAEKLELIRDLFGGRPIIITSWWRPKKYNQEIGGAGLSAHMEGLAVDFRILNQDPQMTRNQLEPHLARLGIRMEIQPNDLEPHEDWVHIDLKSPVNGLRVFKPGVKLHKKFYSSPEE